MNSGNINIMGEIVKEGLKNPVVKIICTQHKNESA